MSALTFLSFKLNTLQKKLIKLWVSRSHDCNDSAVLNLHHGYYTNDNDVKEVVSLQPRQSITWYKPGNQESGIYTVYGVIYQTREEVFHRDIQTSKESWKYYAQQSIFDEIRGIWIADETLSRVFDISSQSKQKLRSNRGSKIVKIYAN